MGGISRSRSGWRVDSRREGWFTARFGRGNVRSGKGEELKKMKFYESEMIQEQLEKGDVNGESMRFGKKR